MSAAAPIPEMKPFLTEEDVNALSYYSPAFPTIEQGLNGQWNTEAGMTLLDYFAAKAMQGFITSPDMYNDVNDDASAAARSYDVAAAMLEARKKYIS